MKIAIDRRRLAPLAVAVVLVGALALRFGFGLAKTDFHIDEGFSLGITNDAWPPTAAEAPGYETGRWAAMAEYQWKAFSANLAARGPDLAAISARTAMDVHPPLFYWLLALVRPAVGLGNYELAGLVLNGLLFLASAALFLALARRLLRDPLLAAAALAIFALSSATISETMYIRMYELLQACCMLFLWAAAGILFPRGGERSRAAISRAAGARAAISMAARARIAKAPSYLALGAACCLGALAQYYFFFLLAPVALFAAVWLIKERRPLSLLLGAGAVAAGLGLALLAFPALPAQITSSNRAVQAAGNLAANVESPNLGWLGAYAGMVSDGLLGWYFWAAGLAGALVLAVVRKRRGRAAAGDVAPRDGAGAGARNGAGEGGLPLLPATLFFLAASAVVIAAVSFASPYRTARYIVAFFPLFALAFCALMRLILGAKWAAPLIAAAALFAAVHGALPGNLLSFLEGIAVDRDPAYFRDGTPMVIVTSTAGATWFPWHPFIGMPPGARVYIAPLDGAFNADAALAGVAAKTGVRAFHALIDEMTVSRSALRRIGSYGFFVAVDWSADRDLPKDAAIRSAANPVP